MSSGSLQPSRRHTLHPESVISVKFVITTVFILRKTNGLLALGR